jgi:RNA polymerase sigma-70 factor, ECF subfamily
MATQDHPSSVLRSDIEDLGSILCSAREGNTPALEVLHAQCHKYLLLIANRELDGPLRAKLGPSDLVQETLLCAQLNLGQFQGQSVGELRAWVRAILINKLRTARRRFRRGSMRDLARESPLDAGLEGQGPIHALVDGDTPSRQAVACEQNSRLAAAIESLPEDYRLAILMRNFDRSSFAEIGQSLNRSEAAARKLWLRAIERLGKLLGTADETE